MLAKHCSAGVGLAALLFCTLCGAVAAPASAQNGGGYGGPHQGGYANQNGNWGNGNGGHGNWGHGNRNQGNYGRYPNQSNYSYGFYQRPYPYHLDYYRMKYDGSYAPYFGNLYGPPLVQQNFVSPFGSPGFGVQQNFGSPFFPSPVRSYAGAFFW